MASYLVTGGAGFIGSNIVEVLLKKGEQVRVLDNFETGSRDNLAFTSNYGDIFSLIEGDIRDRGVCEKACDGVDYVLHQAALGSVPRSIKMPEIYDNVNITGTLNMLMAARDAKSKRFVFASSSSVYGDTPVLPKVETMVPNPMSPYAVSKITGEHYCRVFNDTYDLPTIAFRYFNVFGPRQSPESQYAAVIPKFFAAFLNGDSPTIYGDGEQTRDFTFIKNVVSVNLQACTVDKAACGNVYNVGCGDRISVNRLAKDIQKITASSAAIQHDPPRQGDVRDSLADLTQLEKHFDTKQLISLTDGLKVTGEWYKRSV